MTAGSFWLTEPAAAFRGFAKGGLALGLELGVQTLEVGAAHEDLAADLERSGSGRGGRAADPGST